MTSTEFYKLANPVDVSIHWLLGDLIVPGFERLEETQIGYAVNFNDNSPLEGLALRAEASSRRRLTIRSLLNFMKKARFFSLPMVIDELDRLARNRGKRLSVNFILLVDNLERIRVRTCVGKIY